MDLPTRRPTRSSGSGSTRPSWTRRWRRRTRGSRPSTGPVRARLYEESLPVGRAFGIPATLLPPNVDAFDAYMAGMLAPGGPVHPGPLARDLAEVILRPPPGPAIRTLVEASGGRVARVPWSGPSSPPVIACRRPPSRGCSGRRSGCCRPASGRSTAWTRARCGASSRTGSSPRGAAGTGVLPDALRQMPQARAADRRIRDTGTGTGT